MIEHILIVLATAAGVAGHILKKLVQQREADKTLQLQRYLTENLYKTALTVFYAGGAVAGLYMTDTVSAYTALLAGFSANSLSGKSDI
jgi:hypothetical protein